MRPRDLQGPNNLLQEELHEVEPAAKEHLSLFLSTLVGAIGKRAASLEVLAFEIVAQILVSEVIDLLLKGILLVLDSGDLVHASAVGLLGHSDVEVKVVNVGLSGGKFDIVLVHLLLASVLLALKDSFGLLGHFNLGELEKNLEVGEEGNGSGLVVDELLEDLAFNSLSVHVDSLSAFLDITLLER